jgi:hypothetical protein
MQHRVRAGWLVIVTACSATAKPPAKPPPELAIETFSGCVPYGYFRLKLVSFPSETGDHAVFGRAHEAALGHEALANTAADAKHYGVAAREFFACAVSYRAVPDGDIGLATAIDNARFCYENAIHAFSNAGELASTGRALLDHAVTDDPRNAEFLRDQLAKLPADCKLE